MQDLLPAAVPPIPQELARMGMSEEIWNRWYRITEENNQDHPGSIMVRVTPGNQMFLSWKYSQPGDPPQDAIVMDHD